MNWGPRQKCMSSLISEIVDYFWFAQNKAVEYRSKESVNK